MTNPARLPPRADLPASAKRLRDWCTLEALPYWAERGLDPSGGFFERLNADGSPDRAARRRVRVQCRIIYTYAHAHYLGWYPGAEYVAQHVTDYVYEKCLTPTPAIANGAFSGCAYMMNPDGSIHDSKRDTYTQTFFLLAMVWRYRAFGDQEALKLAKQTLAFMDEHMAAENGGYVEALPPELPRRHNPHMHLFEAHLALFEATQEQAYLDRAADILALLRHKFCDPASGHMIEFFEEDWAPSREFGHVCEPGHMVEWSWLLRHYDQLCGTHDCLAEADDLLHKAAHAGRDRATGFLVDEISLTGEHIRKTKRNWPQMEYVKAALATARVTGNPADEELAASLIDTIMTHYFEHPQRGSWHDQLDEKNKIVPGPMQASTFYHIFGMAADVDAYLKRHKK